MKKETQHTKHSLDDFETCPHCGVSFQGEEIPEAHRENYGGKTHCSRLIACYSRELDCTTHYMCPDCEGLIARDPAIVREVMDKSS